jgi:hypothetical protein
MLAGPGQQHPVAARISGGSDNGELPAQAVEQARGVSVGVGVDADDGIDGVCEHGHSGRPFIQVRSADGTGLDGSTRRHICDESRARHGQASDQASR